RLTRDGDGVLVSGKALRVPWPGLAQQLVALAEDADGAPHVVVVDPAAAQVTPYANLAGEPRDTIELRDVRVAADAFAPFPHDVEAYLLRGALTRAVLMLGGLERTRDLAVSYVKERSQFGRPIARFQAVQHLI